MISLGAVLLVDWYGLVWMAGLRTLSECLRLAQAAHPLIWLGLGLLLASGSGWPRIWGAWSSGSSKFWCWCC